MEIEAQQHAQEQARLDRVMAEIRAQQDEVESTTLGHKEEVLATRRSIWEDGPRMIGDFAQALELVQQERLLTQQERTLALYHQLVRQLSRLAISPYFGRIDFREAGYGLEPLYIGISSLRERGSGEYLVYDWRAPISSMFYDFEPGPAYYDCDAGRIEGEIELKRQYKIREGRIEYMFDTGLTIDDEVLQSILSKSADNRMRNIVNSIQREQNRVIRDEAHPLLIVQGPAGGGKTSIALHRVAYLLYRYRQQISSDNIVVVSPNELFNAYIADVLPELGEENMRQTTFWDYACRRFGRPFTVESLADQMEFLLGGREKPGYGPRVVAIRYKASPAFFRVVTRYIERLEAGAEFAPEDVVYDGRVIVTGEELRKLFGEQGFLALARRLDKLRRRVFYLLEPLEKARRESIEADLSERPEYMSKAEVHMVARERVEQEFGPLKGRIAGWMNVDPDALYRRLFEDERLFAELAGEDGVPEDFTQIREQTLDALRAGRLGYEDVAPLLLFKDTLEGETPLSSIRHVVVDEAQDYTAFHYAIFKQRFPNARFTVLGDLNQAIHPYLNVNRYESILDTFAVKGATMLTLLKSYRSTREIVEFTKALLPGGEAIEAIERAGDKPHLVRVADEVARAATIAADVRDLAQAGMNSIAVICKTAAQATRLHRQIGAKIGAHLIQREDAAYRAGIVVIPSYLAKGLEFDAVLIADADAYAHDSERKAFYTACTRALHRLHLYAAGAAPLIEGVAPELYEVRE